MSDRLHVGLGLGIKSVFRGLVILCLFPCWAPCSPQHVLLELSSRHLTLTSCVSAIRSFPSEIIWLSIPLQNSCCCAAIDRLGFVGQCAQLKHRKESLVEAKSTLVQHMAKRPIQLKTLQSKSKGPRPSAAVQLQHTTSRKKSSQSRQTRR